MNKRGFCSHSRNPCDKSDTALQANYARLQPGGAVQHYEGLAGDRPNTAGAAGVYAAAGKLPG